MTVKSAGILIYRKAPQLEVFLGHMGGPFWEHKDEGAWGIPKGLVNNGETLLQAAIRECHEEVGFLVDPEGVQELGFVKMKSGKEIHAWATEVPCPLDITVSSNTFEIEWPKGSGKMEKFPEIDRAEWFVFERALVKIVPIQSEFLDRLKQLLHS